MFKKLWNWFFKPSNKSHVVDHTGLTWDEAEALAKLGFEVSHVEWKAGEYFWWDYRNGFFYKQYPDGNIIENWFPKPAERWSGCGWAEYTGEKK